MHMKTIQAQVTDTNHRTRGQMPIKVDFDPVGPTLVQHDGQTYCFTQKSGTTRETGMDVREMATPDDARIWVTLDGTHVWED
jgi:hypothetical protein